MRILAITGLAQSGKDTAARYLSQKYRFKWFDFSRDVLEGELKARKIPITKDTMSAMGDELRRKYGADILAQRLVNKIKAAKAESIVVSGIRSPEEYSCLKQYADKFFMIKLVTDQRKRIERSGNSSLTSRDERDIKNKGLSKVLDLADITIENNGTVGELYSKLDEIILTL